jgi:hypothetical protein
MSTPVAFPYHFDSDFLALTVKVAAKAVDYRSRKELT